MRDSNIQELAALFGGPQALAARLNIGITAIYNWRERGIPASQKWRILELANEDGVTLPRWFFGERAA